MNSGPVSQTSHVHPATQILPVSIGDRLPSNHPPIKIPLHPITGLPSHYTTKLITDKPRIKPQLNQVALALKAFSGIRGDSKPIAAQPTQAKSGKWDQFNLQITPTGMFSWDTTSFWRKKCYVCCVRGPCPGERRSSG